MSSFLVPRLVQHAAERGSRPAVVTASQAWTWGELLAASRNVAAALAGSGVRPGNLVVVAVSRGPEVACAVCGTWMAGAVPAMVDPGVVELATSVCERLRPAAVLVRSGDPLVSRLAGVAELDGKKVTATPRTPVAWDVRAPLPGASHLLYTSGTTQDGKCIVWSETRAATDLTRHPPVGIRRGHGRPGIVVPLSVVMGFQDMLRALVHGCGMALVDEPFPAALRVLGELGVTGFQCTPTHVDLILRSAEPIPAGLRRINVTSAPISGERLRALAARVAPAFVTKSYGMTEVGAIAKLGADEIGHGDTVGRPLADRALQIVDEQGNALPQGRSGEVVVRVAMSGSDGYFLATPELTRRFCNGVLWTGDRGYLDADGFLVLERRAAELLKVGGRMVSAPRIEQVLGALGLFADLAVVGVPHRHLGEVPAVVFEPSSSTPDLATVARLATSRLHGEETPRWFLARSTLPRTASGKLRRGTIAAQARHWVEAWPVSVTSASRVLPARELPAPPGWSNVLARVFAADAAPQRWPRWAGARRRDALARPISVVADGGKLLAIAWVTGRAHEIERPWIAPAFRHWPLAEMIAPVVADAARRLRSIERETSTPRLSGIIPPVAPPPAASRSPGDTQGRGFRRPR